MKRILSVLSVVFCFSGTSYAVHGGPHHDGPCAKDVETLCPGIKPGDGRIATCLKEHQDKVSPECKAQHEKMKEARHEMKEACKGDIEKFCADIKKGRGRIMKCMKQHKDELSEGCRSEMADLKKDFQKKK